MMLLNQLCKDDFSSMFLDPIDTLEFPDYEELIEKPVSLHDVREKLNNKK